MIVVEPAASPGAAVKHKCGSAPARQFAAVSGARRTQAGAVGPAAVREIRTHGCAAAAGCNSEVVHSHLTEALCCTVVRSVGESYRVAVTAASRGLFFRQRLKLVSLSAGYLKACLVQFQQS